MQIVISKGRVVALVFICLLVGVAQGQTESEGNEKTLLILHTNDLHDHVRPDYDAVGGLPFVSGYIRDVRAERNDVIVLDAGDVAEKGDLAVRKTGSEMIFEALSRVGYHAWAPGNHDHDFGIEALHRFTELAGMDILCINLFREDGSLEFDASAMYEIDGVRVGVIGAIAPRKERSLDLEETGRAMAAEAERLEPDTDVLIALVHISADDSAFLSALAPQIDVFVSGHSHEALHEARHVPETGALIVQTGSYGDYVGRLELTLDVGTGEILAHDATLVEMDHHTIAPDLEMLEWVRQKEQELAPEATEIVAWTPREIDYVEVGYLAAAAFREATGADVAFNHTARIVRSPLPAGILDWNAVYRTGGERGRRLLEIELLGSEIESYLHGLEVSDWYQTQWAGLQGAVEDGVFRTNLRAEERYRVVMPEKEWNDRFTELFERIDANSEEWSGVEPLGRTLEPRLLEMTWTEAVVQLLGVWEEEGVHVADGLQNVLDEAGVDLSGIETTH